jgi:hypothetical protein
VHDVHGVHTASRGPRNHARSGIFRGAHVDDARGRGLPRELMDLCRWEEV